MFDTILATLGPWPTLLIGLAMLVLAGDALVKGAVNMALRLGIPTLIVGLTVVAFGTSAPELLVSLQAALTGRPDIAVGNVVGSNIVNVLLILVCPRCSPPSTAAPRGQNAAISSWWRSPWGLP